ncbi:MAG: hypothetical protein ACK5OB_04300 [Pirellula sp.]
MYQIQATMPELRELEVVGEETGEERFPKHIDQLQKLRSLNINKSNLRLENLRMLEKLPDLEDLRLNFCDPMDDAAMSILGSLRGLKRLELDSYTYSGEFENDEAWLQAVRSFYDARKRDSSLKPASRFGCGGITTEGLKKLVHLRDLRHLSLASTLIDDEGAKILSSFAGLTYLDVSNTSITDEGLEAISKLSELKCLRIRNCPISDEGMKHLGKLSKLEELECLGNWVTDEGFQHLRSCTAMRELNIVRTFITDKSVPVLKGFSELQKLRANRSGMTLAGIIEVCQSNPRMGLDSALIVFGIPPLRGGGRALPSGEASQSMLDMGDNPNVNDETLASLQRHGFLSELERLDLSGTSITDEGLRYVKDSSAIRELYLERTGVTDAGFAHLAKLRQLSYCPIRDSKITFHGLIHLLVTIQKRPIEDVFTTAGLYCDPGDALQAIALDLRDLRATDEDLKRIAADTEWDTLLVQGNSITDAGVATLATIPQLRQLWVSGPGITGTGISKLRQARHLETLWITDTSATEADLDSLSKMKQLVTLNLSGMTFTRDGVDRLKKFKFLETLIVDSTALSQQEFEELATSLPNLAVIRSQKRSLALVRGHERTSFQLPEGWHRVLESSGVSSQVIDHPLRKIFGDAHFEQANDLYFGPKMQSSPTHWKGLTTLQSVSIHSLEHAKEAIAVLKELPSLTALSFYGLPVRDEDFRELGVLLRLKTLNLAHTQVTDGVLQYVVLSPELESLEFDNARIEGDGLQLLSQAKKLQRLDLSGVKISDEGLANLKGLKQLRVLNLYANRVDKGLRHLVGLSELRELNLSSTLVTDGTLEVLASLENLRTIDLNGTKVSQDARERFYKRLNEGKADKDR